MCFCSLTLMLTPQRPPFGKLPAVISLSWTNPTQGERCKGETPGRASQLFPSFSFYGPALVSPLHSPSPPGVRPLTYPQYTSPMPPEGGTQLYISFLISSWRFTLPPDLEMASIE